tara:strand:- start:1220 stop:1375 length:156 start_codon:yes stop_codon:yes gene_type:complete
MNDEELSLPSQLMRLHQEVVSTYREQVRSLQIRVAELEHQVKKNNNPKKKG